METIAVGPESIRKIDINAPVADNIKAVAKAKNKDVEDVVAVLLDRRRHETLLEEVRATGARIKLITDGGVAGASNTAFDAGGGEVRFGVVGAGGGDGLRGRLAR